jgi:hypothetical protein
LGRVSTAARNFAATSPSSSRSRFFEKVEWSQAGASAESPTNQAEQEVELEPLHQLAFRADRVERLQQHRPEQHLRRDRRPTRTRHVERVELPGQCLQRLIDDRTDRAQRMIRPNPRLHIDVGKELARATIRSAHNPLLDSLAETMNHASRAGATAFSTAC